MIFVFCASYLSVADTINAVAGVGDNEFLVITSNASIAGLFSNFYAPDRVLLLPTVSITPSRPIKFARNQLALRRAKKELLPRLASLRPDRMVFFFIGFNGLESWLLKKLSLTSEVFYRPSVVTSYLRGSSDLRTWIVGFLASLSYGVLFLPRRMGEYSFLGVSDSFLKRIAAREYPRDSTTGHVEDVLRRVYPDIQDFDVLFLLEGDALNVERHHYNEEVTKVLRRLATEIEPARIAIKIHPDQPDPEVVIPRGCLLLPKFLPASLLLFKATTVVSYASGTLFEAVNSGTPAVSMLHVLRPVAVQQAAAAERYLRTNARHEIFFPETFEELIATVTSTLSSRS